MAIGSVWPVQLSKIYTPDAYPHPRIVIGCGEGVVLFTQVNRRVLTPSENSDRRTAIGSEILHKTRREPNHSSFTRVSRNLSRGSDVHSRRPRLVDREGRVGGQPGSEVQSSPAEFPPGKSTRHSRPIRPQCPPLKSYNNSIRSISLPQISRATSIA